MRDFGSPFRWNSMSSSADKRLLAVDSLRGVAASMVVLFHFYNALGGRERVAAVPGLVDTVLRHGDSGVHIFFVLSGLVVLLNISQFERISLAFVGRFALRRSVRLDPPYWIVIGLSLMASLAAGRRYGGGALGVLANMLYLDNLTGADSIVAVGWTLCLEFQFYLLLALSLLCASKLRRTGLRPDLAVIVCLAPTLLWSVGVAAGVLVAPVPGLFLSHWYLFMLGTAVGLAIRGNNVGAVVLGAASLAGALFQVREVGPGVAIATAALLYLLHTRGKLANPLGGRLLQYLGKISYSLYLIHPVIGNRGCRWLVTRFPEASRSLPFLLAGMVLACVASVVAAHLLWRIVERPAQELARRRIALGPQCLAQGIA
jgi:peptidoglycan/LPS O-acetylase OafA/YrhL